MNPYLAAVRIRRYLHELAATTLPNLSLLALLLYAAT